METIIKRMATDCTVEDGERAVMFKASANVLDRDGEVLLPQGCDASEFEKNPVLCLQHSYYNLPIGRVDGLKKDASDVLAKAVFATRPENHPSDQEWVPDTVFSIYQQRVLNAFSVGFIPIEVRQPTKKDLETYGDGCRRVVSKWRLLEISAVLLPSNPAAVALAVSKGLSKDFASKVLGYTAEPEATPEPIAPATEPATKAIDPEPVVVPVIPKRIIYVVQDEIPAVIDIADTIAKAAAKQVAKARGRITYTI
jgi:phage head maturation protease